MKKKLIEVALPLDEINSACIKEKSTRQGHPSTLHAWWARRPLAAARAVTFASLVDDPSSHPEQFPTEADRIKERERLFEIIRNLVKWENSNDEDVLNAAKAEIMKSTDNNPPAFLDPFAGGGALPLEAQRLGLKAYACDLNPVAVMINKAMIEIPAKYQGLPPINPQRSGVQSKWCRCTGMAEDIEYYGTILKQKAYEKIGHLYPTVRCMEDGKEKDASVIAWLWSRTVKCPNPTCGCEMPLVKDFFFLRKKGNEQYIQPVLDYTNRKISYVAKRGIPRAAISSKTARGANFKCIMCDNSVSSDYIRGEACSGRMGSSLIGIIVEGNNRRILVSPSSSHINIASIKKPEDFPSGKIGDDRRALWTPLYGLDTFDKLFTNRQLTLLTTLSNLLDDIEKQVNDDIASDSRYKDYGTAIRTYLAFVIDKMTDYHSNSCSWNVTQEGIKRVFGLQGIPMAWDYAEANPFCNSSGCFDNMLEWVVKSVQTFPVSAFVGQIAQWDATQDNGLRDVLISTDPPYYDNIGYSDLSDFFYVWMRKSLKKTYPDLFTTLLTPKTPELIASPYRFDGSKLKAKKFFEDGMSQTCKNLFLYSRDDMPVTIYYAFKQSETDEDESKASSGWETMLTAIINAGFSITGTWPLHTERETGLKAHINALASSIVIVCRKTSSKLPPITMRQFLDVLKAETVPALKQLQAANIAPVDLAQSSIGPGIAVYSRYEAIIKSDGTKLGVREALKLINHELDAHLNAAIGNVDSETSYCLALYKQKAFNEISFGEAETLAKAKNVAVDNMAHIGVLDSAKGKVNLRVREDLPAFSSSSKDCLWLVTQQVVHAFETKGYEGVAEVFSEVEDDKIEKIKNICYQLFSIAENNGWTQEALSYNAMITTWDSTIESSREIRKNKKEMQPELF